MIVSVTRLRLRSWRYLPAFVYHAVRSRQQSERAIGCLAAAVKAEVVNGKPAFWTCTLWANMETLLAYRNHGAHAQVMPQLRVWCDEGSYAHWESESDTLPEWPTAMQAMREQGKLSFVDNPSAAHQAGLAAGD